VSDERTYTRQEILDAMALHPCHVTGMHTPEHHLDGSVCNIMLSRSAEGVLALVGATVDDLPRRLHDDCGWCHRVPTQEEYRERLRQTYAWAGEEVPPELAEPAPDAPCFDVPERDVLRAVRTAKPSEDVGGGWLRYDDVREALGLPGRHDHSYNRPMQRLIEKGKVETQVIGYVYRVRAA
jgi:hypothetical protein